MNSIFSVQPNDLNKHNDRKAVETFRDLLWCHAKKLGISSTKVHITSRINVADGGVDAHIDEDVDLPEDNLLIASGTSYQIKAGINFKPWQPSQLQKELFGKTKAEVKVDNLGKEVRRCLENANRYIIVCFGVDPTTPQITKAKKTLISFFQQCGFSDPNINVWGQTHLIGLLSDFPSLCLRILGRAEFQFQNIESWAQNADMLPEIKLGDAQSTFMETIRAELRNSENHLRIIGVPGIGKSRLILETLSVSDLSPNVIYIPNAEGFQHSQLFNELLKSDCSYFVILVIDECPEKERASIWNGLKNRRKQCKLITIDHGPETSADELMKIMECPVLAEEQIVAILNKYINAENNAKHWAPWCEGSPRVAHAVGQNLKQNPDDILKPPATVPIWERFIAGYSDIESESNKDRVVVLRHLALFERFGFESPVSNEAKSIAALVKEVEPHITWSHFQSIVENLRGKKIIQGKTTLFLVPKALHVYLWLDYWKQYGRGFQFDEFFARLPETLHSWFINMFIYAHANYLAQQVVKDVLTPGGSFDNEVFLTSDLGCRFLSVLAEADARETLNCIERTFGKWPKEKLLSWKSSRQNIVWALEKIAIWPETFTGATRVLLKMGAAETASNSNNASGTFVDLFSLDYGPVASTEMPPNKRLPVLEQMLNSTDKDEKALALKACEGALSTYGGFRMVGAEYQGLKTAKLWMPETYGELFDAYRNVWHLIMNISRPWPEEVRRMANSVLIGAASSLVSREPFTDMVLETMEKLISDPATELSKIVSFIAHTRRFKNKNLSEDILEKINKLDDLIAGDSLSTQIQRYVLFSNWNEERDPEFPESVFLEKKISELAKEAMSNINLFKPILIDLVYTNGHKLFQFGVELANNDPNKLLLPLIVNEQRKACSDRQTLLIGGYLNSIRQANEEYWENTMIGLLFDKDFKEIAGQLIGRTYINDQILTQMLRAYKKDILKPDDFLVVRYQRTKEGLSQELIEEVIHIFLLENEESQLM